MWSNSFLTNFYVKATPKKVSVCKAFRKFCFFRSNYLHLAPKPSALPTALHPVSFFCHYSKKTRKSQVGTAGKSRFYKVFCLFFAKSRKNTLNLLTNEKKLDIMKKRNDRGAYDKSTACAKTFAMCCRSERGLRRRRFWRKTVLVKGTTFVLLSHFCGVLSTL